MVERILALAKQKGLKQAFLEEKIGAYRGKITEWKNKKSSPTEAELQIIAELLGTTEAYLSGLTNDPAPTVNRDDDLEYIGQKARELPPEKRKVYMEMMKKFADQLIEFNKCKQ
jgi:transcriptional regulator with XRE-family HTH domain